ncbi:MAG: helix-turn-helix transcriptional regulator [Burkholderiales bacterium]|nr:helix-turn-helix transcriptional regulator [Burkholderiales bacterium]
MPNIGTVLKAEISRLSRKESRSAIEATRKATALHRRDIASLKRQVAQLERQVRLLSRRTQRADSAAAPTAPAKRVRFVAKGLRTQRGRLGLSAAQFGALIGVSAQSVYNWEREQASPRGEQLAKLVALRGIGKREAEARLAQLAAPSGNVRRKA